MSDESRRAGGIPRRRWLKRTAGLVALIAAPWGCSSNITLPISRDTLQKRVAAEFPKTVGKVTLRDPQVLLTEGSDRIGLQTSMATTVEIPLLGVRTVQVIVAGDGRLRYDPASRTFFLDSPALVTLEMAGTSPSISGKAVPKLQALANAALRALYPSIPLHTLDQSTGQKLAKRFLQEVRVLNGRVEVTFGPSS